MSAIDKRVNELHRRQQNMSAVEVQKNAKDQELAQTILIEQNRRILESLQRIEAQNSPKSSAEVIHEMRSVMTDQEYKKLLDARVNFADLEEIIDTEAQFEGYRDATDKAEKERVAQLAAAGFDANGKPLEQKAIK